MSAYMVVATFIPGTDMAEVMAVVKEEQAQVAVLTEQGRLGTINISLPRQTVFIEVVADDEAAAEETVRSLPMVFRNGSYSKKRRRARCFCSGSLGQVVSFCT